MNLAKYTLVALLNLLIIQAHAQEPDPPQYDIFYEEIIDDAYIAVPKEERLSSPAFQTATTMMTTIQVNVDEEGNNIIGDAANEPSIAIDPTNPDRIVIGWRQFETIESNFRQAGIAISNDGGEYWQYLEPLESEFFRSDPVLDTDSEGNFYYNSLNTDFFCDVFKSNDLYDWTDKTPAFGGDKQWMVIDRTDLPSNGNIYSFWKAELSVCDGSFTRSTDNGMSYENCTDIPLNPTRGTLSIGPDGEVYACGGINGSFSVSKSITAQDPSQNIAWEAISIVDLKGEQALYMGPNPSGMLGQVWVATDHSNTETRGNVYLLNSVTRNDTNDPADAMFSRSTDGGETWSEATRINDDPVSANNYQWFSTMSVAPNGRIDVVWLDNRDAAPGAFDSALYYSYSYDGGLSWSENEKLSDSFDPHLGWPNQEKMGDYFHMISYDETAHLAWGGTFNGEQDIYYSVITPPELTAISNLNKNESGLQIRTLNNPISSQAEIIFSSNESQNLQIDLLDLTGKKLERIADAYFLEGENHILWQNSDFLSGMYLLRLRDESGVNRISKLILTY